MSVSACGCSRSANGCRASGVLRDAARPYMNNLREATRQTVHLAILDGSQVVCDILASPGSPPLPSRVGGGLPAHVTGVGKAMLAFLPGEMVRAVLDGNLPRVSQRGIVASLTPGGPAVRASSEHLVCVSSRARAFSGTCGEAVEGYPEHPVALLG
jgi:DNA-binding IclR family transcriptional regulator